MTAEKTGPNFRDRSCRWRGTAFVPTNVPDYWPFSILRSGALRERLIVDLDHGGRREALRMVELLAPSVGMFKIGKHLFIQAGPELLREIRRRHGEIFLDLRFHDTPRLLSSAIAQATRMGVKMFDLHPAYPLEGIERTRSELSRLCQNEGLRRPYLLGIAMYLSLVRSEAQSARADEEQLARLSRVAALGALDGVMTRPEHAARIRAACGPRFFIVTPGVTPEETGGRLGAAQAIRAGASYLVVGKPVWDARDPVALVREITAEMERGFRSSGRTSGGILPERLPSQP